MVSWEVVCIERDEDSTYDDCRAITVVGKNVAENLREKRVDKVAIQLANDQTSYHITVDGREIPLHGVLDGDLKYVRSRDSDRSDDPLLSLPSIEEFQREDRLGHIK